MMSSNLGMGREVVWGRVAFLPVRLGVAMVTVVMVTVVLATTKLAELCWR